MRRVLEVTLLRSTVTEALTLTVAPRKWLRYTAMVRQRALRLAGGGPVASPGPAGI